MAIDERFTVPYIQRESQVIFKFFCPHFRKKGFGFSTKAMTEMDRRIMARWGIKA